MLSGLRRLQKKSLDLYLHDRSNDLFLLFLKLSFAKKCLITKQLRRGRQRQRQKTIGIMSKNDSSARASCKGTQREYSSKPLKHRIVRRILVFKR